MGLFVCSLFEGIRLRFGNHAEALFGNRLHHLEHGAFDWRCIPFPFVDFGRHFNGARNNGLSFLSETVQDVQHGFMVLALRQAMCVSASVAKMRCVLIMMLLGVICRQRHIMIIF